MQTTQTSTNTSTNDGTAGGETRFVSHLTRSTYALVLAGGRGSRLMQLTNSRSKPAVPFGGKFRIIDFTLSNCVNSGIRKIGVATQYKAQSLIEHLSGAGVSLMAASMNTSIFCRRNSRLAKTGIRALPTPCSRISPFCVVAGSSTSSCCLAIISTRWTTAACWPNTRRITPT